MYATSDTALRGRTFVEEDIDQPESPHSKVSKLRDRLAINGSNSVVRYKILRFLGCFALAGLSAVSCVKRIQKHNLGLESPLDGKLKGNWLLTYDDYIQVGVFAVYVI